MSRLSTELQMVLLLFVLLHGPCLTCPAPLMSCCKPIPFMSHISAPLLSLALRLLPDIECQPGHITQVLTVLEEAAPALRSVHLTRGIIIKLQL